MINGVTRANWLPFQTLVKKEVLRFWAVSVQTLIAPTITASLYLFVFGIGMGRQIQVEGVEISFLQFVIPGLILMGVVNNSFANTSSSLFFSRYIGNIVDFLVMPVSANQFILAFTIAAMLRGLLVGVAVWLISLAFSGMPWAHPLYALLMIVVASFLFSVMGIVAAIYSNSWDHLAVWNNFLILPMIFLGGVFYPISVLPGIWGSLSRLNPIFYLNDGFRYGTLGIREADPLLSVTVSLALATVFATWAAVLVHKGYKLKT
ncbi:MAG: ABC transporter permease [Bacteriovoracia bacterium]